MAHTQVWDVDEEPLLRHFCLEDECQEVLSWFKNAKYERPEDFGDRMSLAQRLRDLSNNCIKDLKIQDAMLLALGSLHCLDFNKGQSSLHSEEQAQEARNRTQTYSWCQPQHLDSRYSEQQFLFSAISGLHFRVEPWNYLGLNDLSLIFLKRDDTHNCIRAATLGLSFADRLQQKSPALTAKLLYRRGLGKSHSKDFTEALQDFLESARSLDECKAASREERDVVDDMWRGLKEGKGKMAKGQALADKLRKLRQLPWRCFRSVKRRVRQVLSCHAETLLTLSVILLAPLCACAFGFLLRLLRRT
eukprot:symbB.v1.2.012179.t1/scaffold835.1/size159100/6